jgi:sugar phosphate isomerase/epimerase
MQRKPLRLGSSTSGLFRPLGENTLKLLTQSAILTPNETSALTETLGRCAEQIVGSQIRSIEYFAALPVLDLGLEQPMARMLNDIRDNCEVWSVHAPFGGVDLASPEADMRQKSIANVKRAADIAKGLGAKVLTVHPGLELQNMEPRSVRVQHSGESMAEIGAYCAEKDIRVAVEILPRKCIGNSLDELFKILEIADKPNVGFCLDSNHSFPAAALTDVVKKMGKRLFTLHISDHDDVDERHWLPMRGVINWPRFIMFLKQIGYTGPFMYETGLAYPEFGEGIKPLVANYNSLMKSV